MTIDEAKTLIRGDLVTIDTVSGLKSGTVVSVESREVTILWAGGRYEVVELDGKDWIWEPLKRGEPK